MVELYVVNLVGRFGLESLVDNLELVVSDVELQEVENRSEPCVGDKPRVRFIFVLEVWFN
jgi:hypothetical protein